VSRATPPLLACLGGVALALVACGGPPPAPAPAQTDEQRLQGRVRDNSLDPWPHYELARLYESQGQYGEAIREYGQCINLLPPRRHTRPVLDLGVLHQRLGNAAPARRCYREVLDTFPRDTRAFRQNQDYRVAARSLRLLVDEREQGELRARFLGELGGREPDWELPPPWLAPLDPPPKQREGAAPGAGVAPITS